MMRQAGIVFACIMLAALAAADSSDSNIDDANATDDGNFSIGDDNSNVVIVGEAEVTIDVADTTTQTDDEILQEIETNADFNGNIDENGGLIMPTDDNSTADENVSSDEPPPADTPNDFNETADQDPLPEDENEVEIDDTNSQEDTVPDINAIIEDINQGIEDVIEDIGEIIEDVVETVEEIIGKDEIVQTTVEVEGKTAKCFGIMCRQIAADDSIVGNEIADETEEHEVTPPAEPDVNEGIKIVPDINDDIVQDDNSQMVDLNTDTQDDPTLDDTNENVSYLNIQVIDPDEGNLLNTNETNGLNS